MMDVIIERLPSSRPRPMSDPRRPQNLITHEEDKFHGSTYSRGTNSWAINRTAYDYITTETGLVPEIDLFADTLGLNSQLPNWKSKYTLKDGVRVSDSSLDP